jgi:hypothetical protein
MIHITTFNGWHEDTEIEPSVVTATTTVDDSSSGTQFTQVLVYEGYGNDLPRYSGWNSGCEILSSLIHA